MNRAVKTAELAKEREKECERETSTFHRSFLNGYHGEKAQSVYDVAFSHTNTGFIFSLLIQVATQWSRRGWGHAFRNYFHIIATNSNNADNGICLASQLKARAGFSMWIMWY